MKIGAFDLVESCNLRGKILRFKFNKIFVEDFLKQTLLVCAFHLKFLCNFDHLSTRLYKMHVRTTSGLKIRPTPNP